MRIKHYAFIDVSFNNDPMIVKIVNNAFEDFININNKTSYALAI